MLRMFAKIVRTGIVTEPAPDIADVDTLGIEVKRGIDRRFAGSLAIRQVDAGSCNGCELEIHALNNPYYAIERFGVHFVASPRHADVLLVTGPVSRHMEAALKRTYEATPAPKWVIAAGDWTARSLRTPPPVGPVEAPAAPAPWELARRLPDRLGLRLAALLVEIVCHGSAAQHDRILDDAFRAGTLR